MGIIREVIGPKSKYEKTIPYTYEAKIEIIEGGGEYKSYLADKICVLVEFMEKNNIDPKEVVINEIFNEEEKELEVKYCVSSEGKWLNRSGLCKSFKNHYPSHIDETGCTFEDRDWKVSGP